MKIIGFKNSNTEDLVKYTISLFENKDSEIIDLCEFKNEFTTNSNAFLQKVKEARFLIISLTNDNFLVTIEDWLKKIVNKDAFNDTALFLLYTSDEENEQPKVLTITKAQFSSYGAEVLDTFHLPKFNKNFDSKIGITDIKLSLEFIRKINTIKQNNFNNYFKKVVSTCGIDNTGFENCDASSY
jgi:hypothetical protein